MQFEVIELPSSKQIEVTASVVEKVLTRKQKRTEVQEQQKLKKQTSSKQQSEKPEKSAPKQRANSSIPLVIEGESSREFTSKYTVVNNVMNLPVDISENDNNDDDTLIPTQEVPGDFLLDYFTRANTRSTSDDTLVGISLACTKYSLNFIEKSLFGHVNNELNEVIYINTYEPFCLVT